MSQTALLPLERIKSVFTETIEAAGGTVSNTFEDETRLFIRSVLPELREVGPQDRVQAGVALRAVNQDISVHPYIFRLICINGAILAHILDAQQIVSAAYLPLLELEVSIRDLVQACSAREIFVGASEQMRLGKNVQITMASQAMFHLSDLPPALAVRIMNNIFSNWKDAGAHSRFGLMNAITVTARDIADPEDRWQLEKLGGKIGVPTLAGQPASRLPRHRPEPVEALASSTSSRERVKA